MTRIYTNPAGLALRLRSVAEDECNDDEWLAGLLTQSAQVIEEGQAKLKASADCAEQLASALRGHVCYCCGGQGWYASTSSAGEPEQIQCQLCDMTQSALNAFDKLNELAS